MKNSRPTTDKSTFIISKRKAQVLLQCYSLALRKLSLQVTFKESGEYVKTGE